MSIKIFLGQKTSVVLYGLLLLPGRTFHSMVWKVFRIGTVRYNWPMSAHVSQAFSIVHCTDLEDLPVVLLGKTFHSMVLL